MPATFVNVSPGRRRFLALSAALTAGSVIACSGLARAACRDVDAPWTPSPPFLGRLPLLMQAMALPGLAIAVVEDARVAWTHVAGVMDTRSGAPVDDRTLFEAASLSKPVFAYMVLQLADTGLVDLDRPLVQYRRPDDHSDDPLLDLVTARDVLRHSSGLPNWRVHPATDKLVPAFKPGTRISYSGEAYFWLQLVVETITGQSLDDTMQARLFGPAGMADSSYGWNDDIAARSVYGHNGPDQRDASMPPQGQRELWNAAAPVAARIGKPLSSWTWADAQRALPEVIAHAPAGLVTWPGDLIANAAASLRTTAADYARFITLMMQRRTRAPWELREATRRAMLTPQLHTPQRYVDKGLGWGLETTPSSQVFYHGGSNGGIFKDFVVGDAARRRGIVVMTNGAGGTAVYQRIVREATGLDLLAFDV